MFTAQVLSPPKRPDVILSTDRNRNSCAKKAHPFFQPTPTKPFCLFRSFTSLSDAGCLFSMEDSRMSIRTMKMPRRGFVRSTNEVGRLSTGGWIVRPSVLLEAQARPYRVPTPPVRSQDVLSSTGVETLLEISTVGLLTCRDRTYIRETLAHATARVHRLDINFRTFLCESERRERERERERERARERERERKRAREEESAREAEKMGIMKVSKSGNVGRQWPSSGEKGEGSSEGGGEMAEMAPGFFREFCRLFYFERKLLSKG
ncbi:hypothetical protein ANTPLA_LOCUS10854 [Anthophora plagiata]